MTSWAVMPPITPCMGQTSPPALYASCVNRLSSTSSTYKQECTQSLLCTRILRMVVVLKRTVVGVGSFDNLSGSHLQSQVNSGSKSTND